MNGTIGKGVMDAFLQPQQKASLPFSSLTEALFFLPLISCEEGEEGRPFPLPLEHFQRMA